MYCIICRNSHCSPYRGSVAISTTNGRTLTGRQRLRTKKTADRILPAYHDRSRAEGRGGRGSPVWMDGEDIEAVPRGTDGRRLLALCLPARLIPNCPRPSLSVYGRPLDILWGDTRGRQRHIGPMGASLSTRSQRASLSGTVILSLFLSVSLSLGVSRMLAMTAATSADRAAFVGNLECP